MHGNKGLRNFLKIPFYLSQISTIRILNGNKARADKISTSGGDGKLVVWDLRSIEKQLKGLKL